MIEKATIHDAEIVGQFVRQLLLEIEPSAIDEINDMNFAVITRELLEERKIVAFIAFDELKPVGVITICELAAIYASGTFGEICELFVLKEFRSKKYGDQLLQAAFEYANKIGWSKLQLGTPDQDSSEKAINFYHKNGFKGNGLRLSRTS